LTDETQNHRITESQDHRITKKTVFGIQYSVPMEETQNHRITKKTVFGIQYSVPMEESQDHRITKKNGIRYSVLTYWRELKKFPQSVALRLCEKTTFVALQCEKPETF